REIRELLEENKPAPRMQLITAAANEGPAVATEREEDAAVLLPLSAQSLEDSRVAFLAGSAASARRTQRVNPENGPALIDLSGALEDLPEARLRAPLAEPEHASIAGARIQVIAHPAAIALAMFAGKLSTKLPIRRWMAHIFEPASERGKQGLD